MGLLKKLVDLLAGFIDPFPLLCSRACSWPWGSCCYGWY
jgi:hypothetical protein